jgi:hypothetical protein
MALFLIGLFLGTLVGVYLSDKYDEYIKKYTKK